MFGFGLFFVVGVGMYLGRFKAGTTNVSWRIRSTVICGEAFLMREYVRD